MRPLIVIMVFHYIICQPEELPVQRIPEKCDPNTEIMYRNCCILPPFFTREVARKCGSAVEMIFTDSKYNVSGFRRIATNGCDYWWCVLDRYSLLTQYGNVDEEKYYAHLDLWVGLNPMFADVMLEAKVVCKREARPDPPIKVCMFFPFHSCIRNYLNVDCPVSLPTKGCLEKKAFFKECKEYYIRK